MPFFEDTGPRPEEERHPVWRAFSLVGEQLERMLLLNLAWVAQGIPLILAIVFPEWPGWLRIGLAFVSAVALVPATGAVFGVLKQVSEGVPISVDVTRKSYMTQLKPSFVVLLPLYSLFYWLYWLANLGAAQQILIVDVLARLGLMLLGVISLFWGPITAAAPQMMPWQAFNQSIRLFWRAPGRTLVVLLAIGLATGLGMVSIAGFFLITPVLTALFQTQLYRSVVRLE